MAVSNTAVSNKIYIPLCHHIILNDISVAADVMTNMVLGFAGNLFKTFFVTTTPVTTGAKLLTLNWEIGSVNTVGGTIALTSALCTPLGAIVAGSAFTGSNSFGKDSTISLEAASVTQFTEGQGTVVLIIEVEVL